LGTEAFDLDDADEREEDPGQLGRREKRGGEEADAQQLTALDARDDPALNETGVLVRPNHALSRLRRERSAGADSLVAAQPLLARHLIFRSAPSTGGSEVKPIARTGPVRARASTCPPRRGRRRS